jgi:4-amino-4-deoxy-L-arabinose transferase-like glycosyltransferase
MSEAKTEAVTARGPAHEGVQGALAACGALLLLIIWVRPGLPILAGVDAACYARIAADMARRPIATWCEMRLWDMPFYDHPPGFILLLALAFRLFGASPAVALAVGRGMATLAVLGTGAVAHRLAGPRGALAAWLVLPTLSGFLFESQNPMLEMPLTVGLLACTWGALRLEQAWGWALCGIGCVAALGSKGPPGLAILPVWAFMGWRGWAPRRRLAAAAALALALCGVCLLTFEAWRAQQGLPAFSPHYVAVQLWPSMIVGRHNPVASPWFYGPVLWRWYAAGLGLAAVAGILARRRVLAAGEARLLALGAVWCAVFVLGFTAMRQKYPWYVHPTAPGFAWMGAAALAWGLARWRLHRATAVALTGVACAYGGVAWVDPALLHTRRPTLEAFYVAPPPTFAAEEARLVAYCDGPLGWRENHTMGFLWQARIVPCDSPAPWRFVGGGWRRGDGA